MRPHLNVQTDESLHPFAEIPPTHVWGLVEYLSYQRPHVSYHFDHGFFTVTFLGQTPLQAQQVLDDWAAAEEAECEHVDAAEAH